LDLNDPTGRFHIARDFVPPAVSLAPNLSVGSSANRWAGGELAGLKAMDREWSFSVHVTGESEAEVRHGISVLDSFLRRGTADDPVFLHVRGSEDVSFEPLWGQYGSDLRYEIIYGSAAASREYTFGNVREEELPECQVSLLIKPAAAGLRQHVGFAKGGILEDTVGVIDGFSRGVVLGKSITSGNQFVNPIFGNATYDTGWTTGANLVKTRITDPRFVLFGKTSVKVASKGATLNAFTGSVTHDAGAIPLLTCYVKKLDNSAPTSADCELIYDGTNQTTTFVAIGNGWYLAWARPTAGTGAKAAGIVVKIDRTVFLGGFQSAQISDFTPVIHGDLLGCSWDGTPHNSVSHRTAAYLRVPASECLEVNAGTIRMVIRSHQPTGGWNGSYGYLFDTDASGFSAWHTNSVSPVLKFNDGTNEITATGQTWTIGQILVLHFVWASGKLKIYLNGAEVATGTSFTPPASDSWLYVGSDATPTGQLWATIMDFTTFAQDMSAADVLADYGNIVELVEDDRQLMPVPWLWSRDGDQRVENCNDSSNKNYCVIGGVPGSAPARTRMDIQPVTVWTNAADIWWSQVLLDEFVDPDGSLFRDHQGTVESGACGGQVSVDSLTGGSSLHVHGVFNVERYEALAGRDVYAFIRLKDAGDNLQGSLEMQVGSNSIGETDLIDLAADTTQRLFIVGPMPAVDYRDMLLAWSDAEADNVNDCIVHLKRTTGSAADISADFVQLMLRPLLHLDLTLATTYTYRIEGNIAAQFVTSTGLLSDIIPIQGDPIEFVPGKLNLLLSLMGAEGVAMEVDGKEFEYDKVYITPRWALL
jgi:hypothetical protein